MTTGTHITAFCRAGNGALIQTSDPEAIRKALIEESGLVWVDLLIGPEDGAPLLSEIFRFHPLTIEDCVSPRLDPAKIDDHGGYIFIVVQALEAYVPDQELHAIEVDFYLGPNYVVSCHRQPVPAISQFQKRCARDDFILSHTADWLLHGLLDSLVDEFLPIVDAVDDTIDRLEELVLHRPDSKLLGQIMIVKRNALRLRRATTPQRDIMNRLSRGEYSKLISEGAAIYYRDVYDHLVRIEYLVEALRDLADGALQTYLSVISNRLNEVMKVLTVAVVPVTIGTLISGLYGMNLTAGFWPPSDSEWGFGAVAASMVAIAILALAYFRYRNWI